MPSEFKTVDVKCCCFNFLKRRYREVNYPEHQVKPTAAAIQQQRHVDTDCRHYPPTVPRIQVNNRGGSSADQYRRISEVRSITEMDSSAATEEAAYRRRPYLFQQQQQQEPRQFHHNYYLEPAHHHDHPPANYEYYISTPDHHQSSRQLTPQFYFNNDGGYSSSSGSYSGGGRYSGNFLALPPASSTAEQGIVKVDYDNFPNQSYAGCTVW